jgi:hypothetical protein
MKSLEIEQSKRLAYLSEMELKTKLTTTEINILIKYAIEEPDLSANGYFIKPCIEAIGVKAISQKVLNYYLKGTFIEKIGALKLWYWIRETTEKVNLKNATWTKIESAIKNNQDEYNNRLKNLLPDLETCTNPVINFYFKWAISPEQFPQYYKGQPETIHELYFSLKSKNDIPNIKLLKELSPFCNFEELKKIVLFLDLDGVLITTPSWRKDEMDTDGYSKFNSKCVENLNTLLQTQYFEIWLSSSRRKNKTEQEFNKIFSLRGILENITGFLPIPKERISRKDEIETFIKENRITDFLILDDDKSLNGLEENLKQNLVLTKNLSGFNKEKLTEAIEKVK